MRTFAIEPSHSLVREWVPLRDEIEAALDRSQVEWYALEVYRRRRTIQPVDGEADTTILITGRRDDDTHWRELDRAVCDICESHGKASLRIELVDGMIDRYAPPSEFAYETIPPMGSSIGAAGVKRAAGTLGGFVTLSSASEREVRRALTCHHVLCPSAWISDGGRPHASSGAAERERRRGDARQPRERHCLSARDYC